MKIDTKTNSSVFSSSIELLKNKYERIRNQSISLCKPLQIEDYVVQPIVDVSPPKWHLAHTTWFFENLLLNKYVRNYQFFHQDYNYFFNSYYDSLGDRVMRPQRGNMTRPTVKEIMEFRQYVDEQMQKFFYSDLEKTPEMLSIVEIGLQHEQQHQELLLTDIKYILGHNPLFPVYQSEDTPVAALGIPTEEKYNEVPEGVYEIGYKGNEFHHDNETSRHKIYLDNFRFLNRLITNQEYLEFIEDGGYRHHEFWLSDGWEWINNNKIKSPLYWHKQEQGWYNYKLSGFQKLSPVEPVTHVSYYEANAFANWKGKRLLTEQEWEVACQHFVKEVTDGNFVDHQVFHPQPLQGNSLQMMGDCWEWTQSAYLPYPNYQRPSGALGEYNGKFMINQMVLRGGSCATPSDHIRSTYRNFFHPHLQWQFTGIRLAENI